MKTKSFLLLSFAFYLLSLPLFPQGFNYQALVRNASGTILADQNVGFRFSILQGSTTGTVVYSETHDLNTDGQGVVSLVIGNGSIVSGSFTNIDWSNALYYLKVEMDPTGGTSYSLTETKRIQPVAYALFSEISDSITPGRLEIKGDASQNDEEALFEVKRNDGQTVLAVYPDGVRIYVMEEQGKGTKGGFAVGGFDPTKGITDEYLRVSPDSVRIYISPSTTKASKGGFAVGGYDPVKGLTGDYFNVSGDPEAEIVDGEARVMWYPIKEAFRAGNVLIESKDSVGKNSWASGYRSKAIGNYSQALGYQAIARKDYSTAIGYQAVANKINSFAFGQWAKAKNEESYALGRGAIAEGFRSFALGSAGIDSVGQTTGVAYAKGDYSFAIGQGSQALGKGAFTLGLADTAKGDYSIALGYQTSALGFGSTVMGGQTTASGSYSTAMGYGTTVSGYYSTAMGYQSMVSGAFSSAIGYYPTASGLFSIAMGNHTIASAYNSTAMGGYTTASGGYSTAMGAATTASGGISVAMGYVTKASGDYSTAMGYYSEASGLGSTAMGYRATASGGGVGATAMGYYTIANSDGSTAIGTYTTASGVRSTAIGAWTTASGSYSTALGYSTTASGYMSTAMNYGTSALSGYETVIGRYNANYTPLSPTGWDSSDKLFVIGNGTTDAARANAFTVLKNGRIGLQSVTNPTYALELPNSSTVGVGQARAYAWATYSDARVKTEQEEISYGLREILSLQPKQYNQHFVNSPEQTISSSDKSHTIGLIAQDVYEIIPEAVNKPDDENISLWSLDYDKLVPVLIKAMQEQQSIINEQKTRIDQLDKQVSELNEIKTLVRHMQESMEDVAKKD
jgi:hypothetical protein